MNSVPCSYRATLENRSIEGEGLFVLGVFRNLEEIQLLRDLPGEGRAIHQDTEKAEQGFSP